MHDDRATTANPSRVRTDRPGDSTPGQLRAGTCSQPTGGPGLDEMRASLYDQAAKLGLQIIDPNRRTPGTVRLRFDGALDDINEAIGLLTQREVHLQDQSAPQAKRESRGGVLVYATLNLLHPDNTLRGQPESCV
ncbi:hypothetical protein [Nonomuraea sp. NPDC049646]|uniref:hypothetical protein n=1 Tax=unclassified Nonomuraea TaxID=2593643 RepID=UPI0037ACFDE8